MDDSQDFQQQYLCLKLSVFSLANGYSLGHNADIDAREIEVEMNRLRAERGPQSLVAENLKLRTEISRLKLEIAEMRVSRRKPIT